MRTVPSFLALRPAVANSSHFSPSRSRQQHLTPLTSLAATLMDCPLKCCKHKTYGKAKPFRCNTYRKPGVGGTLANLERPANRPCGRALLFKFFLFTLLHTLLLSPKLNSLVFMCFPTLCPKPPGCGGALPGVRSLLMDFVCAKPVAALRCTQFPPLGGF